VERRRIVAQNPVGMAFVDNFPISRGHTLIIPLRHVTSIFDLTADELAALWDLVAKVRNELAKNENPAAFTIGVNDGKAAGQTVEHAHIHVIPRYEGDVDDPRGGVRWVIPKKAIYW
jgi:diadenosine tetraphosphate (Ap4A) HIT family hydrolase